MKGVPLRLEVGPRDMASKQVFAARRDTGEKFGIAIDEAGEKIAVILDDIQKTLYQQALDFRAQNTHTVDTYEEFKKIVKDGGFVKCGWDGTRETEDAIKADTKATIRVIPFDEKPHGLTCIYSGEKARHQVIFAKAY